MINLTRQDMANRAAEDFAQQYCLDGAWYNGRWTTYQKLVKLGPKPNPDDVDKVVNNSTWTRVCRNCLIKSVDLIA